MAAAASAAVVFLMRLHRTPSLSLFVSFFDFTAKLRMRMQQTAFLLWPFAIVPPMCCQFGAQRSALATVAASYAGFLVPAPLLVRSAAAAPSARTVQRFAIALQIARLNVRRLPAAKAGSGRLQSQK